MNEPTLYEVVSELENAKTPMALDKPGRFVRIMVDSAVSAVSEPVNYFGRLATISF